MRVPKICKIYQINDNFFFSIYETIVKLLERNSALEDEFSYLSERNRKLFDENDQLKKEFRNMKSSPIISIESLKSDNAELNKEICNLKKIISKFIKGKRKF